MAAFFPLLFWPGVMGEFMTYLPTDGHHHHFGIAFVAMVLNPALAAYFMRAPGGDADLASDVSAEEIEKAGEAPITVRGPFLRVYRWLLEAALNHRLAVVLMGFLGLVAMAMVWFYRVGLEKPIEFFPNIDPHAIYVNLDMPEGPDLDYSDRIASEVETALAGLELRRIGREGFSRRHA